MRSFLQRLNHPVVAIAAVAVVAGALRFSNLGYPETRVFDEIYYSKSACIFIGYSRERCDIRSDDEKFWEETKHDTGAWVHPPLGKWAIGLGEKLFGTEAFGWRVASAAAGTLTVVVIAMIAQLLFGSALWTFVAGLLLATEHLNFVQSRMSMLDIFVAFWVALGFLLLLFDRRWIGRRTPPPPVEPEPARPDAAGLGGPVGVPSPLFRPWRLAAGVAFGAAFASKWSGLAAVLGAIALSMLWESTRRKRAGTRRYVWRAIQVESFGVVISLLILPAIVYVLSYAGWFVEFGLHPGDWLRLHGDIASYHFHLEIVDEAGKPIHPYLSEAWKWILMWRPVAYYFREGLNAVVRREILGMGSPAIFWASLVTIPYLAIAWRRKRDWRAGFMLVAILAQYVPWLVVSRPQFFFYVTPITPFLVLAATYSLKDLSELRVAGSRSRPFLPVAVGFVIVSVALFAFFWPVLVASPLSLQAWKLRMWFPSWV